MFLEQEIVYRANIDRVRFDFYDIEMMKMKEFLGVSDEFEYDVNNRGAEYCFLFKLKPNRKYYVIVRGYRGGVLVDRQDFIMSTFPDVFLKRIFLNQWGGKYKLNPGFERVFRGDRCFFSVFKLIPFENAVLYTYDKYTCNYYMEFEPTFDKDASKKYVLYGQIFKDFINKKDRFFFSWNAEDGGLLYFCTTEWFLEEVFFFFSEEDKRKFLEWDYCFTIADLSKEVVYYFPNWEKFMEKVKEYDNRVIWKGKNLVRLENYIRVTPPDDRANCRGVFELCCIDETYPPDDIEAIKGPSSDEYLCNIIREGELVE